MMKQSKGQQNDGSLPAMIRLPISAALFCCGVALTWWVANQPTNEPDAIKDTVLIFGNLIRGLLYGMPLTVGAMVFNHLFKPRTGPGDKAPTTPIAE